MFRSQQDSSVRSRGSRRICPNTAGRPRRACTACSRNCTPGTSIDRSRSRRLACSGSPARRSRTPLPPYTPGPARRSNNISCCRRAGALVSVPPYRRCRGTRGGAIRRWRVEWRLQGHRVCSGGREDREDEPDCTRARTFSDNSRHLGYFLLQTLRALATCGRMLRGRIEVVVGVFCEFPCTDLA